MKLNFIKIEKSNGMDDSCEQNLNYIANKIFKVDGHKKVLVIHNNISDKSKIIDNYLKKVCNWSVRNVTSMSPVIKLDDINWCDAIVVMDSKQEMDLLKKVNIEKPIINLAIPSFYEIYSNSLNELLEWMYKNGKFNL